MSPSCRNCGAPLAGRYCASCGQSDRDNHDTTLRHLLHELTHEVTHVDGTIGRTLGALFTQPGRLTAEYWAGRRASWIRPFRIFIIAAALHFASVPGIGPMNLDTLVQRGPSGDIDISVGSAVARQAGAGGRTPLADAEQASYRGRLRTAHASVRYFAVPLFALGTFAVYCRRQAFYANHLVLAVHYYAFWYVLSVLASLPGRTSAAGGIAVAVSAGYLFLSLRRLFPKPLPRVVLRTAVLSAPMIAIGPGTAGVAWIARQL